MRCARLRALKEHVRAEHVVLGEGERVSERVVDVRLRGAVDDRVDLLRREHIAAAKKTWARQLGLAHGAAAQRARLAGRAGRT